MLSKLVVVHSGLFSDLAWPSCLARPKRLSLSHAWEDLIDVALKCELWLCIFLLSLIRRRFFHWLTRGQQLNRGWLANEVSVDGQLFLSCDQIKRLVNHIVIFLLIAKIFVNFEHIVDLLFIEHSLKLGLQVSLDSREEAGGAKTLFKTIKLLLRHVCVLLYVVEFSQRLTWLLVKGVRGYDTQRACAIFDEVAHHVRVLVVTKEVSPSRQGLWAHMDRDHWPDACPRDCLLQT